MSDWIDKVIFDMNNAATKRDERFGLVNLSVDTTHWVQHIKEKNDDIIKAINNKTMLETAAQAVINSAVMEKLIPYKPEYKLRIPKGKVQRDKEGKIKYNPKTGEPRRHRGSPSQYFSRVKLDPMYEVKDIEILSPSQGEGEVYQIIGYTRINKQYKRQYWHRTSSVGEYGKSYTLKTWDTPVRMRDKRFRGGYKLDKNGNFIYRTDKQGKRIMRKHKEYYTDHPTHLKEIKQTHRVSILHNDNGINQAQIIISNKKIYDKRFVEPGGEQYANFQYFADDANWKRTTEGTTSRWLEVAIGLPVTDGAIKIPSISTGERNQKIILNWMKKFVKGRLGLE